MKISFRASALSLLALAACLIVPSSGVVARYLRVPGLLAYIAVVFAVLFAVQRWVRPWLMRRLTQRQAVWLAVAFLLAVTVTVVVLYPFANSGALGGGSDRDDALNVGVRELLAGRYPYHQMTYLDNPISPMPGAFLLAAPFVLLFGSSAYQNLFWLAIFYCAVQCCFLRDHRETTLLAFTALALSPAIWQELATGGDLLTNALYVFAFLAFMLHVHSAAGHPLWQRLASAVLLGIGLASRANFLLTLLPLALYLAQRRGWPYTVRYLALTVAVFALLVAPFYLHDPAAFWPAHTTVEVDRFAALVPHAGLIILALTALSALLVFVHRRRLDAGRFLYHCALPQAVPVLLGLAAYLYVGRPDNAYAGFGINFMFFGLVAASIVAAGSPEPLKPPLP